jgi:hypothetical protein
LFEKVFGLPAGYTVYFPVAARNQHLILFGAALVGYRAAGFACALAGALAFAASAGFHRTLQPGLRDGLKMFHRCILPVISVGWMSV